MEMKKSRIANLPPGVGVTPNNNGTKQYWMVRLGRKFTGGKAITKNFTSLAQARTWIFGDATELAAPTGPGIATLREKTGTTAFALSLKELTEAADAFKRCEEANMTLREAVDFAIKHNHPTGGKITIADAIDELITWKQRMGKRSRYLEKLKGKLLRFSRHLPASTNLNEVTTKTIEEYLASLNQAPAGEIIEARHLSVLFGWAVKKGYAVENPIKKIEKPNVEQKPPTTLKPGEVLALLNAAQELTPWVVIGLFAGFRPEEAQKLDWEDIDFQRKHIDLPGSKAKDRVRRIVPFLGNLETWLLPFKQKSGLISPANFRRRFWKMCERAGYRASEENGKTKRKQSTATGWPKDVLRHCFGSYHLAKWHSAGSTAELMGHRDTKMLYNHYRDVIKDESDVEAYWQLHPDQLHNQTS